MSGHTPGPWVWQNGCSWWRLGHDHDGDVMRPEVMTDGWPTLSFLNGGPYGPDARLIAAAPDLLEALERIVDAGNWYMSALELDDSEDGEGLEALARAVIAKARGHEDTTP